MSKMPTTIESFLNWLRENDIGVGLCYLHQDEREVLTRDEWLTLIDEYITDRIEGFDGT